MIPMIMIAAIKAFGSSAAQKIATEAGDAAASSITNHLEEKHSDDHEGEKERQLREHAWELERILAKTAAQLADAETALLEIRQHGAFGTEGSVRTVAAKYFEDHPVRVEAK